MIEGLVLGSQRPALRALAGIVDLPVRVGAVEKRARLRPTALAAELEELLAASCAGARADADALLACSLWLLNDGAAEIPALHATAVRDGHELVAAMLADDAPHRGLARGGRLPDVSLPETRSVVRYVLGQGASHWDGFRWVEPSASEGDRPLPSLEELKSFFAVNSDPLPVNVEDAVEPELPITRRPKHPIAVRREVKELVRHPSPFTVGRLLDGRSIALRDVVEIAARRPTTAAIVRELTSRPAWMHHQEVRSAMAMNPCTPTRVALLLMVTCRPRLRAIASRNVHPRVRELARLLSAPMRPSTAATTRSQRERWNS